MKQLMQQNKAAVEVYARQWAGLANWQTGKLWLVSLGLWFLVLVATPIILSLVGRASFPAMATAGVLAQVSVVLVALARRWSLQRILWVTLGVAGLTWGAEYIGHTTDILFGAYHYTAALQSRSTERVCVCCCLRIWTCLWVRECSHRKP